MSKSIVEVGLKFEITDPFLSGPRLALARPGEYAAIASSSTAMGSVSLTRRRRVIPIWLDLFCEPRSLARFDL